MKFRKELAGDNGLIAQLDNAVSDLEMNVMNPKYISWELTADQAIEELSDLHKVFKQYENLSRRYNHYEETLSLQVSTFENVRSLRNELDLKQSMWRSLKEWKELTNEWTICRFREINPEEMRVKAEHYQRIVNKCTRKLPTNPVLDELKQLVFEFKESVPIITSLRNPKLTKEHLQEIRVLIDCPDFDNEDEFLTLQQLLQMNVVDKSKDIVEISTQATQEANLTRQITIIEDEWRDQELVVKTYKEDMYIIGEVEEIQDLLDKSLANINNIMGSRYLKRKRDHAAKLQKDLFLVQDTLDEWLTCQKNWMYLENIFRASDIKSALKSEAQQFEQIDKFFKKQMANVHKLRTVMRTMAHNEILKRFRETNEALDRIQKQLEAYLELKRQSFPRFYFLSNDELLEILAHVSFLEVSILYVTHVVRLPHRYQCSHICASASITSFG